MLDLPRNLHFEGHKALNTCHEICTSCACHEICTTKSALRGSQSTAPATKSANEPHVQKIPKVTTHCACHEIRAPRRSPPKALHRCTSHETCIAPIPCACQEKSTLEHQNTRFPLRLPRKVTTMSENARGATNESAVTTSTCRGQADSASLRSRNALRGFREYECTANNSEFAGHVARHRCLTIRTPI